MMRHDASACVSMDCAVCRREDNTRFMHIGHAWPEGVLPEMLCWVATLNETSANQGVELIRADLALSSAPARLPVTCHNTSGT